MSIYKLGQTRFAQPSCRGGFNPVITGLEVFKKWRNKKNPSNALEAETAKPEPSVGITEESDSF